MDTKIKCNNGTFVGKQTDELIIWKGIPYATQPVGKPDDVLGRAPWQRVFQEGLLTRI